MAVDETQRLIMQVEGEMKVRTLTEQLQLQKKTLMELMELQAKGPLTGAQQQAFTAAAAGAVASTAQLNELTKSMRGLMGSQGMMQIGYGLQDIFAAQGGFAQKLNAASNNIQMLAMSMGVGGGWFIAFTALTSALQLAANNWDKINAWIQDLPDPAELKAKADKAKAAMADYEKLRAQPTPEQEREAAQAAGAIAKYGGGKLTAGLEREISARGGMPETPEEARLRKEAEFAEGLAAQGETAQGERASQIRLQLQEKRRARVVAEAERVSGEAQQAGPVGEAARARLKALGLGAALTSMVPAEAGVGPPEPDYLAHPPPFMRQMPGATGAIPREGIPVPGAVGYKTMEARRQESLRAEAQTPLEVRPTGALGPEESAGEMERLGGKIGQAYEQMSAGMLNNRDYKAFQAMENRLNQLVSLAEQRAQYDASHLDLMTRVQMLGQGAVGQGITALAPTQW